METSGTIGKTWKNMQHTSSFESMTHDETVLQNWHKLWLLQVAFWTWQDGATLQQSCDLLSMLWLKARFPVCLRTLYLCLQTDKKNSAALQAPEDRIFNTLWQRTWDHLRTVTGCALIADYWKVSSTSKPGSSHRLCCHRDFCCRPSCLGQRYASMMKTDSRTSPPDTSFTHTHIYIYILHIIYTYICIYLYIIIDIYSL